MGTIDQSSYQVVLPPETTERGGGEDGMSAAKPEEIKPKSTLLEGVILQETQKDKDDDLQDQLNEQEGQKLKNKDGEDKGIIPI